MKSVIKSSFVLILFLTCLQLAGQEANSLKCTSRKLKVIFINGVLNEQEEPAKVITKIKELMKKESSNNGKEFHPLLDGDSAQSIEKFIKFEPTLFQ
ncbi:hypothetical protein A9Q84_03280 [Halobacteriovorax marinus]|uniref:Uncharacterized protein n=1 Tax=Halobacteriovorax marinus TaxID=97084 RepID=A0A1Y5FAC1_9BACT|nr:hypothetical protein A9Q84_03280 [Halobacteriovorax marinus]